MDKRYIYEHSIIILETKEKTFQNERKAENLACIKFSEITGKEGNSEGNRDPHLVFKKYIEFVSSD